MFCANVHGNDSRNKIIVYCAYEAEIILIITYLMHILLKISRTSIYSSIPYDLSEGKKYQYIFLQCQNTADVRRCFRLNHSFFYGQYFSYFHLNIQHFILQLYSLLHVFSSIFCFRRLTTQVTLLNYAEHNHSPSTFSNRSEFPVLFVMKHFEII